LGESTNTCPASGIAAKLARLQRFKVPEGIPDDKVLFLSDIFPTGCFAAENRTSRRATRSGVRFFIGLLVRA